jgi:UDPglucose 6-dehydrogenase
MQATIGIVGNGFVGNAVAQGFQSHFKRSGFHDKFEVRVYDVDKDKSTHSYMETLTSDYVFVCLPTPMISVDGGKCNLSILEDFFDDIPSTIDGTFIIKSTVPIGTTDIFVKKYPYLKIIHNPEFLTAANAENDFINSDRHVIGGDKRIAYGLEKIYEYCFPGTPVYIMKSNESEAVKYFSNCFLASKVMIFNEMKILCDSISGMDYNKIIEAVTSDSRIGESHTSVPGPDGEYGFGGTCFPKDINALIYTMEENGIDPLILKSVWEQNKKYRLNWDWAENTSAVMSEKL